MMARHVALGAGSSSSSMARNAVRPDGRGSWRCRPRSRRTPPPPRRTCLVRRPGPASRAAPGAGGERRSGRPSPPAATPAPAGPWPATRDRRCHFGGHVPSTAQAAEAIAQNREQPSLEIGPGLVLVLRLQRAHHRCPGPDRRPARDHRRSAPARRCAVSAPGPRRPRGRPSSAPPFPTCEAR